MTLFQPCLRASHLHNFRPLERNSCASSRRRLKEGQHDEAVMLCDMSCWLASGPLPAKVAPRGNPHVPTCTPPCPPKFTCSGIDVNSPTMAYYLPFSWGNPLKSRRGMKASPNGNCPFFERLCVYNRLHFRRRFLIFMGSCWLLFLDLLSLLIISTPATLLKSQFLASRNGFKILFSLCSTPPSFFFPFGRWAEW